MPERAPNATTAAELLPVCGNFLAFAVVAAFFLVADLALVAATYF